MWYILLINFSPAILKQETLLYKNIYILIHLILYSQSDFDSKKKSGLREKKTCHMMGVENGIKQKLYRFFMMVEDA